MASQRFQLNDGIRVGVVVQIVADGAILGPGRRALLDVQVVEQGLLDAAIDLLIRLQHHGGEGGQGRCWIQAGMGTGLILRRQRQRRAAGLQLQRLRKVDLAVVEQAVVGLQTIAAPLQRDAFVGGPVIASVKQQLEAVGRGLQTPRYSILGPASR